MASAADIGASGSSYQGDASLGGFNAGVIKIDTSPIQQMAHYAVMYNKSQWEQNQLDTSNKIAELAKIGTLNPNNAIEKDKPETLSAYTDLLKFSQDFARKVPKTQEEKVQQSLEWQAKLADVTHKITSANARSIAYQARKLEIQKDTTYNAQQKELRLKQLDKEANETDIYTPLPASDPKFNLTVPKIGDPVYKKFSVLQDQGNGQIEQKHTTFDPAANMNASFLEAQGLRDLQNRTPRNDMERQEFELSSASDSTQKVWQDASDFLNAAINDPKYKDGEKINFERIQSENPLVRDVLSLADKWNAYATQKKADIAAGYYTDNEGNQVKINESLNANDYFTIDPTRGISAPQMVFLEKFAKAAPDAREMDYKHTGDANTSEKNKQDYELGKQRADADGIYKRAMAGAANMKAKAYVDNVKQQMKMRKTAAEQDQMLADLFTKNIAQQPNLYYGNGGNGVEFRIDASTSLPLFTFDGKSPKQLIPIGATPIGEDGKPIEDLGLGGASKKVAYWQGGHYETRYVFKGQPLSSQQTADFYSEFKQKLKSKGKQWNGSLDDFLKQYVEAGALDVRLTGQNGTTDKQLSMAAQRAISNQATGKGETPVFSSGDAPPTDDAVSESE
jgi:hypothetical protein